ncbi:hypothetical protein RIF29_27239 [Crotalaria pallida]|uniref:Tudor domain-containing protein n=1 Tax=Crotalaria pallida TaxID=3830 RepID=A0AAN9EPN3_CROPI
MIFHFLLKVFSFSPKNSLYSLSLSLSVSVFLSLQFLSVSLCIRTEKKRTRGEKKKLTAKDKKKNPNLLFVSFFQFASIAVISRVSMASAEEDKGPHEMLLEAAAKLTDPPTSSEELIPLLEHFESCLSLVGQFPVHDAMTPLVNALLADKLRLHLDVDVRVAVTSCISEITRIAAPEPPFTDDQMKEVFQLIVSSFENLHDMSSRSYKKRIEILKTVSKVRSYVIMLDLECDALILDMFQHFLKEIREQHPEDVFSSMQHVMTHVIEDSEDISLNLLTPILDSIKEGDEEVLPSAKKLAEIVLESCATKLKPYLVKAVNTSGISLGDYSNVLASICQDGSGSLEQNDACATSEHAEDESKSAKEPLEESTLVLIDNAKEAAPLQTDNPVGDRSPKSVMTNGIPQAAEDDTLVDSKSLEKQEKTDCDQKQDKANDLDTIKVDNSEQKQDQATMKRTRITISLSKSAEPSEGSYPSTVKQHEKVVDSGSHCKEVEEVTDSESHSKKIENVIDSESYRKGNENVIDSDSHSKEYDGSDQKKCEASRRGERPVSSIKSSEPSEGSYPANVKVIDSESQSKDDNKLIDSDSHIKEDSSDQKQCEASERRGKKPISSVKSAEPSEGSYPANVKVIDSESPSKKDEKVIDCESHSKEGDNGDQKQVEASGKRGRKPIVSTKLAEPPKGSCPANAKEDDLVIVSESLSKEDNNNDQKHCEAKKKRGRKLISSAKSEEPSKGSNPANVKRDEKVINAESHNKRDEEVIDSESQRKEVDNNVQKQGEGSKKRARKPISSTRLAESSKSPYPADATEDEKMIDSESYSKEVDNIEQKQGPVRKKRGRKTISSKKLVEPSKGMTKKEVDKVIDSESHSKEVANSLHEDGDDSVEAAGLSENDKEIDAKISSLKAGDGESNLVASPSRSGNLLGENRSKKLGRSMIKNSSAKEMAAKDVLKKVYEETSDSEAKPPKRAVKKAFGHSSDVKKNTAVNSVKKRNGSASEPDTKMHSAKKAEDGSKGGAGSSLRISEDKKRQGRGKANSETGAGKSSVKEKDKEMVSLPKSATKSIKHEDSEQSPKTKLKRKRTPIKENESGTKKYGDNLVGSRVKVWWPEDEMFYEGIIASFSASRKTHKVNYDDGDVEILNLKKERWEIIEGGADSDLEGGDHESPDASADMPPKKKGKTSTAESKRGGHMGASSTSGRASSSKSTKSSSFADRKSKASKIGSESEDEVIRKMKNQTPKSGGGKSVDAAQKRTSKSKDTDKVDVSTLKLSGKAKQETPRTGKLNQETLKTAAASKEKPIKSGGKSNSPAKVKFVLSSSKDSDSDDSQDSTKEVKVKKARTAAASQAKSVKNGGKSNSPAKVKFILSSSKDSHSDKSQDSTKEVEVKKTKTSSSLKAGGSEIKRGKKRGRN